MYNFLMEKTELIYDIMVVALMAVCLLSHILLALSGSGKGIKIFFCIFSGAVLISSILLALVWKGIVVTSFTPIIAEIKKIKYAPFLAMALVIICTSEFSGMLYLLKARRKSEVKQVEMSVVGEAIAYTLPDNVRKANTRKHGEYKIVKGEPK